MSDDVLKPLNQPVKATRTIRLDLSMIGFAGSTRRRRSASLFDAKRPDRRDGNILDRPVSAQQKAERLAATPAR